jgi:hypothetical protein
MKITFESVNSYPCIASYRTIADCGDVVSVRRDVLVTIAPYHNFVFFVLSTSSHNTSSRRPGIISITIVVQNEKPGANSRALPGTQLRTMNHVIGGVVMQIASS